MRAMRARSDLPREPSKRAVSLWVREVWASEEIHARLLIVWGGHGAYPNSPQTERDNSILQCTDIGS